MPDTETIKPEMEQTSSVPEPTKPDQTENAGSAPSTETENAAQDQTADPPTKEATPAETLPESAPATAVTPETESPKKTVEEPKDVKENGQNVQSPGVPEAQQQTIGAGDTCVIAKQDENANTLKPEKDVAIADQVSSSAEKLTAADDKQAGVDEITISKLKQDVQKANAERDSYRKKLEGTEKRLAVLQSSYDALLKGEGDEVMLRRMVDQLKAKLIQTSLQLEDRIRIVTNQEKQISALNSQVASLKEVESLTRSLLIIRNEEAKQLKVEMDDMVARLNQERDRYDTTINKMKEAAQLSVDLKTEYSTQLRLFRDLKEKYEEKVTLLTKEKQALEDSIQGVTK